jgi:tRNA threonylcarbamoyladenosine biosynthesis protein TsaB
MVNILAIETSSELCTVALLVGEVITEREAEAGHAHSELVLPMVALLMKTRQLEFPDLDGIAFGAGPGSFTGLRIACGVAQGLAFGAGLRVAGIGTLEALAEAAWQIDGAAGHVVACIDARMGEVYHAAYRREGEGWRECSAPGLYAPETIPVLDGDAWVGAGSGFAAHGAQLRARQPLSAELPLLRPRARMVAVLAAPRFAEGRAVEPGAALPLYLRDKVALTTRERRA